MTRMNPGAGSLALTLCLLLPSCGGTQSFDNGEDGLERSTPSRVDGGGGSAAENEADTPGGDSPGTNDDGSSDDGVSLDQNRTGSDDEAQVSDDPASDDNVEATDGGTGTVDNAAGDDRDGDGPSDEGAINDISDDATSGGADDTIDSGTTDNAMAEDSATDDDTSTDEPMNDDAGTDDLPVATDGACTAELPPECDCNDDGDCPDEMLCYYADCESGKPGGCATPPTAGCWDDRDCDDGRSCQNGNFPICGGSGETVLGTCVVDACGDLGGACGPSEYCVRFDSDVGPAWECVEVPCFGVDSACSCADEICDQTTAPNCSEGDDSADVICSPDTATQTDCTCPPTPPQPGDACPAAFASSCPVCTYSDCDGAGRTTVSCQSIGQNETAWVADTNDCATTRCPDGSQCGEQVCVETIDNGSVSYACADDPCATDPLSCDCAGELCGDLECSVTSGTINTVTCQAGALECSVRGETGCSPINPEPAIPCCEGLVCCDGVPYASGGECHVQCTLLSDANLKSDVSPFDHDALLETLMDLPISTWSYDASPQTRHLGPMAQDFSAAFGLGDSDERIHTVDGIGVALAAIQALNHRLETENAALRAELRDLARACSTANGSAE